MAYYQWNTRDHAKMTSNEAPSNHEHNHHLFHSNTIKASNIRGTPQQIDESSPSNESERTYVAREKGSSPSLQQKENEVDYYYNPTELFRWINYRKWGGAWARVQSNPEECSTWVVSRHSSDGRVLWRQLPLHLVCMQCGIDVDIESDLASEEGRDVSDSTHPTRLDRGSQQQKSIQQQQLEKLTEEILYAYPEAASAQDDQGMLPLHLLISNTDDSTCINERILLLLLVSNPAGLLKKDNSEMTPLDLLLEKRSNVPGVESALRILTSANEMVDSVVNSLHDEATKEVKTLEKRSENERKASQRIIARLEDELAEEHRRAEKENSSAGEIRMQSSALQDELLLLKKKYDSIELDLDQVRRERDELIAANKDLTDQLDNHDEIVAEIKRHAEEDCAEQKRTIANLKSETNAARAMVDAVQNQLRSKFTNEQELINSVEKLENKVTTLNVSYQKETKNLQSELERLKEERKSSKTALEELTNKNKNLQLKNNDLSKSIEDVLFSHSALSAEYDKLLDSSKRYENRVLESINLERDGILASVAKQKKMFEAVMNEHAQIIEESNKKEKELAELIAQDRKKQHSSVSKIKDDYQAIRTHVSNQHMSIAKEETSFPQRHAPSPGLSRMKDKTNKAYQLDGMGQGRPQIKKEESKARFPNAQEINGNAKSYRKSQESSRVLSTMKGQHQSQTPCLSEYLDQKSNEQQKKNRPSPPNSFSFETKSTLKSSTLCNSQYSKGTRQQTSDTLSDGNREAIPMIRPNQSDTTSQKSFSLDEFSDLDSKTSSCTESIGNDYAGMTAAIKKGMIRLNSRSKPQEMRRGVSSNVSKSTVFRGPMKENLDENYDPSAIDTIRERFSKQRSKYSVNEDSSVDAEGNIFSISSGSDIMPLTGHPQKR